MTTDAAPSPFQRFARRPGRFAIFFAIVLGVALVASTGVARARSQEESHDAKNASDATQDEKRDDSPVKWLPDQRVLKGAPPASLDLNEVWRQLVADGRFGENAAFAPEDAEWSIVSGQSEIADLEIADSHLKISWKPDAVGKTTVVLKATPKGADDPHAFISFKAESWTPNYLAILMATLGGGGLFLLGMKRMSDGLQAMAGSRLRRLVSLFTNNRFLAVGVGAVVTTLVQSSTATSVMTLGFVNSGLMTLMQATGVLLGANIGTTTTGWLFALNVGAAGLPLLGVAALFYLFCKNERIRNVSTFLLGLGMIFFGLETLKEGLSPLPDTPQFSAFMQTFEANSMKGAVMCVVIGCVATVVAHSSAATLALTMTLASLDAISFNSSAAIVLGSNIGTSLTPIIVAIGAPANTRRAAYFHVIFNTAGVVLALAFFFPVLIPSVNGIGAAFDLGISGRIALTHTLFNVVNTAIFLPILGPTARALERWVSDTSEKKLKSTTGLESFSDDEPTLAIERSRLEVQRMFLDCRGLLDDVKALQENGFEDDALIQKAFATESKLDAVQDETIDFISKLTTRLFTEDAAASAREQIRIAEELETISDYLASVVKSNLKLKEKQLALPESQKEGFKELLSFGADTLEWLEKNFSERKHSHLAAPTSIRRRQYVARAKEIRQNFMQSMFDDQQNPIVIIAVDSQLNAWRRIYEHLQNIAEAMETPGVPLVVGAKRAVKQSLAAEGN